jgi:hypothetical protein
MSNVKQKASKEITEAQSASSANGRQDGDVRTDATKTETREESLLGKHILYRKDAKKHFVGLIITELHDGKVDLVYFSPDVPDRSITVKKVKLGTAVGECSTDIQSMLDAIHVEQRLKPLLNS